MASRREGLLTSSQVWLWGKRGCEQEMGRCGELRKAFSGCYTVQAWGSWDAEKVVMVWETQVAPLQCVPRFG